MIRGSSKNLESLLDISIADLKHSNLGGRKSQGSSALKKRPPSLRNQSEKWAKRGGLTELRYLPEGPITSQIKKNAAAQKVIGGGMFNWEKSLALASARKDEELQEGEGLVHKIKVTL